MPLSFEAVRVLGTLVEKSLATPDYYPMTVNALTQACNQKTTRDPVVAFEPSDVTAALDELQRERLVGTTSSSYGRAVKYRHLLEEQLGLTVAEQAALAMLMLRGPQTVGEIRGRTERLYTFDNLEQVEAVLRALQEREEPLVTELPRQPGQKEARYAHLLAGPPEAEEAPAPATADGRVARLEAEVETLRTEVDALRTAFESFRGQFE